MTLRQTIGRLLGRDSSAADTEIAPPELGGLRLAVPGGYAGVYGSGYEPAVTQAIMRLVQPGMVCADVGAHIGFFAFLMAHRVGSEGRVIAFEANEGNAAYVRRSAELNAGSANVELRHAAVTDGATPTIELFPGRSGGEMEWTISRQFAEREDSKPTTRRAVTVPTVRLDDVFAPGERLDVVKMDIEGGEAVALPGAGRVLSEQRPVFVVEFHREVGWPGIEHLIAAGYRFEDLDGRTIDTPTDAVSAPYQFVARP